MRHSAPLIMPETWHDVCRSANPHNSTYQPMFGEFQLLGDNILVRFTNQILYDHQGSSYKSGAIDYCIKGQRIQQLDIRIKLQAFPLSRKVMVLIGTSDVLNGANIHTMVEHFNSLLTLLKECTDEVLILTLPPIPKLCATFNHWTLIRQYNDFLKSLDDGRSIIVADICPLFTKFAPALECEISVRDSHIKSRHQGRKRKSWPGHRRTKHADRRRWCPNEIRSDESDYRNSSDTNTSVDSDALSSEQDRENIQTVEKPMKSGQKRSLGSQGRFVVRTLQSVFGKELFGRKKAEEHEPIPSAGKRLRKSPMDLNDNICSTDSWIIESDEDSMSELVYKSQEETEYDLTDVSSRTSEKIGEFSRFVESLNDAPKRSFSCKRGKKSSNEKAEDTESSSSSCIGPRKRQVESFIDPNFRCFLEKSSTDLNESFRCNSAALSSVSETRNRSRKLHDSRNLKNSGGLSGKNKLLMDLASKICYLEFYELYYSSRKRRIDMTQLNHRGLNVMKDFLISNNYIRM